MAPNCGMIVNDELDRTCKKAVMVYFYILSSTGGYEENHEKS